MIRHRVSSFTIMAILGLIGSVAYGFVLWKTGSDVPFRWQDSELPVAYMLNGASLDMTDEEAIDTFVDSFVTWGAVGSSSAASTYGGETTDGGFNASDGQNTLSFDDTEDDLDGSTLGLTYVTYSGSFTVTGGRQFAQILDADIVFNDDDFTYVPGSETPTFSEYDLQSVATHEIGHLFGLGHPPISDATMYEAIPPGTVERRDLHFDDVDAISYTYTSEPLIGGVDPGIIEPDSPTSLTVTGTGFVRASQFPDGVHGFSTGASVTIGGQPATSVSVVSPTQITCVTSALSQGEYDVTVTNPDTTFDTLTGALEVASADGDGDGLLDEDEVRDLWGADNPFDPLDPDSTGDNFSDEPDGVPDGQNDYDGDGQSNSYEFEHYTNPTDPDSRVPVLTALGFVALVVLLIALFPLVRPTERREGWLGQQ